MTKHRFIHTAALALAIGALAAPTASATTDYRSPDTRDAAAAAESSQSQDLRSPDARDSGYSVSPSQTVQDYRSADTRDFAAGREIPEVTVVKVATPAQPSSSGLDWGDVGIGAGALLGLIMLGLGGTAMVMHRRRSQPAI